MRVKPPDTILSGLVILEMESIGCKQRNKVVTTFRLDGSVYQIQSDPDLVTSLGKGFSSLNRGLTVIKNKPGPPGVKSEMSPVVVLSGGMREKSCY